MMMMMMMMNVFVIGRLENCLVHKNGVKDFFFLINSKALAWSKYFDSFKDEFLNNIVNPILVDRMNPLVFSTNVLVKLTFLGIAGYFISEFATSDIARESKCFRNEEKNRNTYDKERTNSTDTKHFVLCNKSKNVYISLVRCSPFI